MKRSQEQQSLVQEHACDPYVKRARREGWRSPGSLQARADPPRGQAAASGDRLSRPRRRARRLESVCEPWSCRTRRDSQPIFCRCPYPGRHVHARRFSGQAVDRQLAALGGRPVDLVMSDLAPKLSGIDASRSAPFGAPGRARPRSVDSCPEAQGSVADQGLSGRRFRTGAAPRPRQIQPR